MMMLISSFTYSQNCELRWENYLEGKWKAECEVELLTLASWKICPICPAIVTEDQTGVDYKDIDMTFGKDSLTLNQNGKIRTVAYIKEKDNYKFSFAIDDKQYKFRLILTNDKKKRILEDADGLLIILTKED